MNRRVAFPFLVLPDEAIQFKGWMIGDPEQPLQEASQILENWDYARDLQVFTKVSIDWDAASTALGLSLEDLRLNISLVVGTGSGRLPRKQQRLFQKVVQVGEDALEVSAVVSGSQLSGRLRLALQIGLEAPINSGSILSPKTCGARLWQDIQDILIEDGGDARFPIETISFNNVFKGRQQQHSPWYLHWRPGTLRADFSGTVRLYVNSDFQDVAERFVVGDRATLQAIMGDVVSQMIECTLNDQGGEDLIDCEVGSVGNQICKWLDLAFPGKKLNTISALKIANPGEFRAAILASMDLGESE